MRVRNVVPLGIFALTLVAGCNIFSWSSDEGAPETHLAKGQQLMTEKKYAQAAEEFALAIEGDPRSSEARYYHAKAVAHAAGLNLITMGQIMTDTDWDVGEKLPFTSMSRDSQNILYSTNVIVTHDLQPIFDRQTTGLFEPEDISMDLAIALGIYGTLRFRDTNSDGRIDDNDFTLDVVINDQGEFSLDNLDSLISDTTTAEAFNELLADAESLLVNGGDVISFVLGDTTGFNPSDLDSVLGNIGDIADRYFINSGLPGSLGQGDGDSDGQVDEECLNGIDDDGDGFIDEDARMCTVRATSLAGRKGGRR